MSPSRGVQIRWDWRYPSWTGSQSGGTKDGRPGQGLNLPPGVRPISLSDGELGKPGGLLRGDQIKWYRENSPWTGSRSASRGEAYIP